MTEAEARVYWSNRWRQQGPQTVGHAGDSDDKFRDQTRLYGLALQEGLTHGRPEGRAYQDLLDFGCGWGRMVPHLKPHCVRYFGADLVPEAVQLAGRRTDNDPGVFFSVGLPTINLHDVIWYDAIVCCTVLQHIVAPSSFAQTVALLESRLNIGGRCVLLENTSPMNSKPHIVYRTAAAYIAAFAGMRWEVLRSFMHNGEEHTLLVGDRV